MLPFSNFLKCKELSIENDVLLSGLSKKEAYGDYLFLLHKMIFPSNWKAGFVIDGNEPEEKFPKLDHVMMSGYWSC